jgi:hypothetical protein
MLFSELRKYFDYAGVKATDCWDKNYKDEYIAKLYTYLSTLYESNDDAIKYMIIAAAWGGETAIEFAHRYSIPYNVKPQIYVY